MPHRPPALDLYSNPAQLTAALIDIPSVSGTEAQIADAVEAALRATGAFTITRDGDAVVARTDRGLPQRVILAGHLDTVPIANNVPSSLRGDRLYGCGSSDMKSGVAMILHLAATITDPHYDLTLVLYDNEEVSSDRNGLGRLARNHPELLVANAAIVAEPTAGQVEAGCQGVLRAVVHVTGRRAHAARSWLGSNAIQSAGQVLARLEQYQARSVTMDGCTYREGLSAVGISGGVAGNVIPDACDVELSFRYAPDRSPADARDHLRELFVEYDVTVRDEAPAAAPGLSAPLLQRFIEQAGVPAV
ncbi:MAG: succinyl-diaminopimelate desuccinylase, partial [Mycobacteriales bacterium]